MLGLFHLPKAILLIAMAVLLAGCGKPAQETVVPTTPKPVPGPMTPDQKLIQLTKRSNAQSQGMKVQEAIAAYRVKHNVYPKTLPELVTDGELSQSDLHNDSDKVTDPSHVSWTLCSITEGEPGKTPLLTENYDAMLEDGTTRNAFLIVYFDGSIKDHVPE